LATLEDAAQRVQSLPAADQQRPHWQPAIATLIDAAEGRDFLMHARVGMLRALNAAKVSPTTRVKPARSYRIIR
jgi:hypothetical protein